MRLGNVGLKFEAAPSQVKIKVLFHKLAFRRISPDDTKGMQRCNADIKCIPVSPDKLINGLITCSLQSSTGSLTRG